VKPAAPLVLTVQGIEARLRDVTHRIRQGERSAVQEGEALLKLRLRLTGGPALYLNAQGVSATP